MDNQCPQGLRHHLQGVRQCRRHLTKGIHRSPAVDPRAGTGREVAGAGMAIVGFGPRTMEMAMVVATVPQPYEAPLRPQLTGTTVAPTGGATDRRRLGGCHDPSPKNDGCGACSHSYSLHRPWANTAASRPSNAAATNPNHRDPGGPMTGAGRAVTGDGMVSAGFGSGRNGDCSSSSASAPISVSALTGTTFATTGAGRSDCSCSMGTCLANCFGSS